MGALLKRPLLVGLVFAFGWEQIVLLMPGGVLGAFDSALAARRKRRIAWTEPQRAESRSREWAE